MPSLSHVEAIGEAERTWLSTRKLKGPDFTEIWTTLGPTDDPKNLGALYERLRAEGARPVFERVFGSLDAHRDWCAARQELLAKMDFPGVAQAFVEGASPTRRAIAGVHTYAVVAPEARITPIESPYAHVEGTLLETQAGRRLFLAVSSLPSEDTGDFSTGAAELFERIGEGLASQGMSSNQIVRTWFFLADIDADYDEFNGVRTDFFGVHGVDAGRFPASTGVGGSTATGGGLHGHLVAVDEATSSVRFQSASSQCSPFRYGSAFSRSGEVVRPNAHSLFISGTASIEPGGSTYAVGDTSAQWERTLRVFSEIVRERGRSAAELCHLTLFVANTEIYNELCENGVPPTLAGVPFVPVVARLCRDDLLVEVDGVAVGRS